MDVVLDFCDEHLLTPYVYPSWLPEDNPWRQLATLFVVVCLGGTILYLMTASLSYVFVFDQESQKLLCCCNYGFMLYT